MTDSPQDNPFGGESPLAGLGDLLAGARERLGSIETQGSAGGGAVTVTMDGERRLRAITISPEAMAGGPEELQDLILAAANEAFARADEARTAAVSGMFPGLTS